MTREELDMGRAVTFSIDEQNALSAKRGRFFGRLVTL
jgi:hypothetical protein